MSTHNEVRDRLKQADELRGRVRALESLEDGLRNPYIAPDIHWYDGLLWWRHDKREDAKPRQEITREEAYELRQMIPELIRQKRDEYERLEASVDVLD